jgi:hypothetical protein
MRVLLATVGGVIVAALAFLAFFLLTPLGDEPVSKVTGRSPERVTETVTEVVTEPVEVPATASLAEWEADLAQREEYVNEMIDHLQGREKAILAAEEKCGL